jgi:arsenate reductase-like glutaredoxin family protein
MVEHEVVLYSRPGCHLCDDVRRVLESSGISHDEVDITRDAALEAEYRLVIPVVEHRGRVVFEAGMDPGRLPRNLRAQGEA